MTAGIKNPFASLDVYGRRRIVQVLVISVVIVAVYFLIAGRADLTWGWVYAGVVILSLVLGAVYVLRRNPQAINERGRPAENQKRWDKAIIAIYTPLSLSTYLIAGLDARFGWSAVPLWLHLLGAFVTLAASLLTYTAMAHNPFLAQVVQIAAERGHQVATSGPYQFVRHPMYASLALSWPALACLFGSWWALIPALLASALIVVRTVLEDRTLRAELPGYADYARQVRYRLLPGVW